MSLDKFTAQLAAAGAGALPDGEHIGIVSEIRETRSGAANIFVMTSGERRVRHYLRTWAGDFTLGQTVTLKVWRQPDGKLGTALRAGASAVFTTSDASLSLDGELTTSVKAAAPSSAAHATPSRDAALAPPPAAGEGLDTPGGPSSLDPAGQAWEAHQLLLQGLITTRLGLSDTAEACYLIREGKLYGLLGYEKLGDYLADPEISLRSSSFHEYADIWKRYVLVGGIEPGRLMDAGRGKLAVPLPALKAGEVSAADALEDAIVLGAQDLRVKYRGQQEPSGPAHDCPRCRGLTDEQLLKARSA